RVEDLRAGGARQVAAPVGAEPETLVEDGLAGQVAVGRVGRVVDEDGGRAAALGREAAAAGDKLPLVLAAAVLPRVLGHEVGPGRGPGRRVGIRGQDEGAVVQLEVARGQLVDVGDVQGPAGEQDGVAGPGRGAAGQGHHALLQRQDVAAVVELALDVEEDGGVRLPARAGVDGGAA